MVGGPDRRSQWLKGLLDLCVLGILTRGEAYGYEIARTLEEEGIGEIKGGTLYPALAKLETEGFVEATWRSGESGPNRKYYLITESGRGALAEDSTAWAEFANATSRLIDVDREGAR